MLFEQQQHKKKNWKNERIKIKLSLEMEIKNITEIRDVVSTSIEIK